MKFFPTRAWPAVDRMRIPSIAPLVIAASFVSLAIASGLIAPAMAQAPAAASTPEVYTIDVAHSGVRFEVRHLFSPTPGRFKDFQGTLHYDPQNPAQSRISLTIQTASIDTDNEKRDGHLRTADFLDAEKYPTIVFESDRMEPGEKEGLFHVHGNLTIRGVTRPVTMDVEMLGFGDIPGMGRRGGFIARTTIDRTQFGVVWNRALDQGGALLGNEIKIECPIEVILQEPEPAK